MQYLMGSRKDDVYYVFSDCIGSRYLSRQLSKIASWYVSYVKFCKKQKDRGVQPDSDYCALSKVVFTAPNTYKIRRLLKANF